LGQIERRAADDLEHVGGGRLLLQGFAQLVQQPRVFDSDVSQRLPNLASQMRVAFSKIASKTGCKSPGDELMTRKISAVAVCCSSASLSSRVSATFVFWPTLAELRPRTAFLGRCGGGRSAFAILLPMVVVL
jgi:hypothetical protein